MLNAATDLRAVTARDHLYVMMERTDDLLRRLSARLGGKVSDCLSYDANVCTSVSTADEPWRLIPSSGAPFSSKLRSVYRGRKLELMANRDYLEISVKGRFAGGSFTVNAEERIGFSSRLTSMRIVDRPVFTADGRVSSIQAKVLQEPVLVHLIAAAGLQPGESLHFF